MLLFLLVLTGCGSAGAGARFLPRSTRDRKDDLSGPQIHFVYAVPAGRAEFDHHRDTDGTLANSIFLLASWFYQQRGSPIIRIDTYRRQPDITFVRLPQGDLTYERKGPLALMRDLARRGLRRRKLYAVFYDGTLRSAETCGLGASGAHPFAIAFVAQQCFSEQDFTAAGFGSYNRLVFVMAHEIVHELGFVPDCAPHSTGNGHVDDSPRDLMFPYLGDNVPTLDVNHDDYYRAHAIGCRDLSDTAYLRQTGSISIKP